MTGTWTSAQNLMAIHPMEVEIFQSGPTDQHCSRLSQPASTTKNTKVLVLTTTKTQTLYIIWVDRKVIAILPHCIFAVLEVKLKMYYKWQNIDRIPESWAESEHVGRCMFPVETKASTHSVEALHINVSDRWVTLCSAGYSLVFRSSAIESIEGERKKQRKRREQEWRGTVHTADCMCVAFLCVCGWRCTLLLHHGVLLWLTFAELYGNKTHKQHTLLWTHTLWTRGHTVRHPLTSGLGFNTYTYIYINIYIYLVCVCVCVWPYLSVSGGHTGQRSLNKGRLAGRRERQFEKSFQSVHNNAKGSLGTAEDTL